MNLGLLEEEQRFSRSDYVEPENHSKRRYFRFSYLTQWIKENQKRWRSLVDRYTYFFIVRPAIFVNEEGETTTTLVRKELYGDINKDSPLNIAGSQRRYELIVNNFVYHSRDAHQFDSLILDSPEEWAVGLALISDVVHLADDLISDDKTKMLFDQCNPITLHLKDFILM